MSLMEFARLIIGLGLGFIVTGTIFVIGDAFTGIVVDGEKPDGFIVVMAILIWLRVSYGVISLML